MHIGIAVNRGGFELAAQPTAALKAAAYEVVVFGVHELATGDDCPDLVCPRPGRWRGECVH
jgi:ribose 5-phosphate isomerase B